MCFHNLASSIYHVLYFSVDKFDFKLPCVGPINRCHIEHDGSGSKPAWKLDKVIIEDVPRSHVYEFPCMRWLSKDKDDGKIALDLSCPNPPAIEVEGPEGRWKGFDFHLPHISMPSFHLKKKKPKGDVSVDAGGAVEYVPTSRPGM